MIARTLSILIIMILVLGISPARAEEAQTSPGNDNILNIELAFDHIDVTSGFSGAYIEVFGHRRDKYTDVAIIVKGPEKNIIVWKKAQILGAWINRYGIKFKKMPLYYAFSHSGGEVFSDLPAIEEIGLGMDGLLKGKADVKNPATKLTSYQDALIDNMKKKQVFVVDPQPLNFINDYFFRTRFSLPANAPTGTYKIQSFLFKQGKLIESDTDTLKVEQVGLNAFVHESAHEHAVLYGLICIALALSCGWFVGILRVKP